MRAPFDQTPRSGDAPASLAPETGPWILTATILASSMAFIDGTVVNVAIPTLQNAFHATVVDVQWVVESYGLFLSALILAGGALGDLFGRRRIFLLGIFIFAASSAACGLAPSIRTLIIARSVQGLGAALLVPGSLAIISASFDEEARGQAIGTWSGFTAITTAFGPVLGGWLIEHGSWRWAFFINLPLACAVVLTTLWRVPESRASDVAHIDWLGAFLATCGLGGVVTSFLESSRFGWSNPLVFGSLIAGLAGLVLFVWVEMRESSPMLPLALFRSGPFTAANLITLFLYSAVGIFFFLLPMDLIQLRHYSTTATGAAILPMILLMFFLSRWSGGLVGRYGARLPLILGPLIVGAGFILFALLPAQGRYWTTCFPAMLVLGLGMAVTVAPLTTLVMSSADQNHVGAASGVNNAVARVAGVLAIAVLGIVMVKTFSHHLDQDLANLSLPPGVVQNISSKQIELAGMELPNGLDPHTREALRHGIANSFLAGFRLVMFFCTALAAGSAVVAARMIPNPTAASVPAAPVRSRAASR